MKAVEIEFKNLLTAEEYKEIYESYNLAEVATVTNANYYYDTADKHLKECNSALRVRHTESYKEMTLKIKGATQNIEVNVPITNEDITESMELNSLPESIKLALAELSIESGEFSLLQQIKTERKEQQLAEGLLVLDKTYFLGNVVDYELEFEVANYEQGKIAFEKILAELNIERKEAKPKIARAVEYSTSRLSN